MRKIKIICCVIVVLTVFTLIPNINRSIVARVFLNHNIGKISLIVNGEKKMLHDIDITLIYGELKNESESKIKNNEFKFRQGDYGENKCIFKLPAKIYDGHTDIVCEVCYFSANNWNINNFVINILITTGNVPTIYADGFVKTKNEKGPFYFDPFSKELKTNDNEILLFTSGI